MLEQRESNKTNLIIINGQFCGIDKEPLGNVLKADITSIRETETENGKMWIVEAIDSDGIDEKEYAVWLSEREFIDFALRVLNLGDPGKIAMRPFYDSKNKARMFCLYEIKNDAGKEKLSLVKKLDKDHKVLKDMPEWVKSGKFYDSSAQADFLYTLVCTH